MNYRVAILEDDPFQQEMLLSLLAENVPDLTVVGIASSIQEGKILFAESRPDLVFMDVQLPPHTSFDLLTTLTHIPFEIIFTTSFDVYAAKAFRLSAVDYLVKPVVKEELVQAVEKFRQRKSGMETSTHIRALLENIQVTKAGHTKVALPTLTGYIFVPVKDIIRCESDNTYTTFFTTDKRKIVVSKTLKECEQMLVDYRFFRVHNSHLINVDYVVEYTKGEGGIVKMTDGSQVEVSRRRKDEFLTILKKT